MDDIDQKVSSHIQIDSDPMGGRYDIQAERNLVWLYNSHERRGLSSKLQKASNGPYRMVKRNKIISSIEFERLQIGNQRLEG